MVLAYVVSLQYVYVEVMKGIVVSTSSGAIAMRRNSRRHFLNADRTHNSSMHVRSVHPQVALSTHRSQPLVGCIHLTTRLDMKVDEVTKICHQMCVFVSFGNIVVFVKARCIISAQSRQCSWWRCCFTAEAGCSPSGSSNMYRGDSSSACMGSFQTGGHIQPVG